MTNLLDSEQIRQPISARPLAHLDVLEVFSEIESTNSYLLAQPAPSAGRFRVAFAEHQTAGRGRLDRAWHSPRSSGICMSMSYCFSRVPDSLPCVTLAIGTGVVAALEQVGARGISLKWPNDLMVGDGKLGGVLTETKPGRSENVTVVVGVGINVDLRAAEGTELSSNGLGQLGQLSDLVSCTDDLPSRNTISTALIESLFNTLAEFDADGFTRFAQPWEKLDWLRGQDVEIERPGGVTSGTCTGIDTDGALLLETAAGRERVLSGSVRLRQISEVCA